MFLYITYEPVNFVINGTGEPKIPPFFFLTQNFFEVLLVICFFQSTLLIFLGYKETEETKIICTRLSYLSGTMVLCGKVSLKCQPSKPPPDPWGGAEGRDDVSLIGVTVCFVCSDITGKSWHYSCPRSVYCRSIVFLSLCLAVWNIPIHNEDFHTHSIQLVR